MSTPDKAEQILGSLRALAIRIDRTNDDSQDILKQIVKIKGAPNTNDLRKVLREELERALNQAVNVPLHPSEVEKIQQKVTEDVEKTFLARKIIDDAALEAAYIDIDKREQSLFVLQSEISSREESLSIRVKDLENREAALIGEEAVLTEIQSQTEKRAAEIDAYVLAQRSAAEELMKSVESAQQRADADISARYSIVQKKMVAADARVDEILDTARSDAEDILKDARKQALEIRDAIIKNAENQVNTISAPSSDLDTPVMDPRIYKDLFINTREFMMLHSTDILNGLKDIDETDFEMFLDATFPEEKIFSQKKIYSKKMKDLSVFAEYAKRGAKL